MSKKIPTATKKIAKLDFAIHVPDGSHSLAMSKETVKRLLGENSNQPIADFHIEEGTDDAGKKTELFVIRFI
jgi:hypothetical protein